MRRRISKRFVDSKKESLARAKEQRDRFRLLEEGKDTPFWKEIQERIDRKAKAVEVRLDEWVGMPSQELFSILEQRKIYRYFKYMVDESGHGIEMLDARIAKLEEEIKENRVGEIV